MSLNNATQGTKAGSAPLPGLSALNEPLVKEPEKKPMLSGAAFVVIYIIGSIMSSVLIVLCNKEVFENGFPFPLTMSFIAYCFTWLYYQLLQVSGAWTKKGDLPAIENIKVALSSIGSISFMNLCLLTNTVAIYQICKFAVIPCTLVIQSLFFTVKTNWRVISSLVLILSGVGWSSGMSFESGKLSVQGIIYAVLAVITTSVYRIWQETKQKEFKLGPIDFQSTMAGWQAGLGLLAAVGTEFFPVEKDYTVPQYFAKVQAEGFGGKFPVTMLWLAGVCLMALTVNFTSFGLIGKTGPIAYAVVGHAKTVLTIIMGILLFPKEEDKATITADIVGCGVAMFGVIAYGHFEYCLQNNKPDIFQKTFGKGNGVEPAV